MCKSVIALAASGERRKFSIFYKNNEMLKLNLWIWQLLQRLKPFKRKWKKDANKLHVQFSFISLELGRDGNGKKNMHFVNH